MSEMMNVEIARRLDEVAKLDVLRSSGLPWAHHLHGSPSSAMPMRRLASPLALKATI